MQFGCTTVYQNLISGFLLLRLVQVADLNQSVKKSKCYVWVYPTYVLETKLHKSSIKILFLKGG